MSIGATLRATAGWVLFMSSRACASKNQACFALQIWQPPYVETSCYNCIRFQLQWFTSPLLHYPAHLAPSQSYDPTTLSPRRICASKPNQEGLFWLLTSARYLPSSQAVARWPADLRSRRSRRSRSRFLLCCSLVAPATGRIPAPVPAAPAYKLAAGSQNTDCRKYWKKFH